MIKLLWRTDVHLSDNPPASRKDDWVEAIFAKLAQVKTVARKLSVDAVFDGEISSTSRARAATPTG